MPIDRPRRPSLPLAIGFVVTLAWPGAAGAASDEDPATSSSAIVGGTSVPACGWPTVAFLGNCTATLIHPRIIVTAAHCAPTAGERVSFGERTPFAFSVAAIKCVVGEAATNRDWAYCLMPEDGRLRSLPIVPPLQGCEKSRYLTIDTPVVGVGFGEIALSGAGAGVKRQIDLNVTNVGALFVDVTGTAQHSLCHGDSGGPLFVHLVDGANDYGWRTVGTTTGIVGDGADCASPTRLMSIDQHVLAIEMNEGIDVTPCTDASGNWAPGPGCTDFPTSPSNGGGSWPTCLTGPISGPVGSCGASIGTGGTTSAATTSATATTAATSGTGGAAAVTSSTASSSVASGAGGSATGGSGGASGAGGSLAGDVATASTVTGEFAPAPETSSGCSCRVGTRTGAGHRWIAFTLLGLAAQRRRRRS